MRRDQDTKLIKEKYKFYDTLKDLISFNKEYDQNVAIISNDLYLSYETMLRQVESLCDIIKLNSPSGSVVSILGEPSPEMTICILAAIAAKRVFVLLDSTQPKFRINQLCEISKPSLLIVCCKNLELQITSYKHLYFQINSEYNLVDIPSPKVELFFDCDLVSHLFFTSGTTGKPNCVIGTKKNLIAFIKWETSKFSIKSSDKFLQLTRPTFDVILQDIFVPLSVGASLVYPPKNKMYLGEELFQFIKSSKITAVHTVPSVINNWLIEKPKSIQVNSLRWIFSIGEPLNYNLIFNLQNILQGTWKIVNLYGTTETGFETCWFIPEIPEKHYDIIPVGVPMEGAKVHILDSDLKPLNKGDIGEVYLEHAESNIGYLNENNVVSYLTKNPLENKVSEYIYRTGDKGFIDLYNNLVVIGRIDDEIKINGVRIHPNEITNFIKKISGVSNAIVISYKNDNGQKFLMAAYTTFNSKVSEKDVKDLLTKHFPIVFVPAIIRKLENIPINNNGKIDRANLIELLLKEDNIQNIYSSDQKEFTNLILAILGKLPDLNRSFIEAGGTSLNAALLSMRIKKYFNCDIMVHEIMSFETLEKLYKKITDSKEDKTLDLKRYIHCEKTEKLKKFAFCRSQLEYKLLCMRSEGLWGNLPIYVGYFSEVKVEDIKLIIKNISSIHDILRIRLTKDKKYQYFCSFSTAWVEWRYDPNSITNKYSIVDTINELGNKKLDLTQHPCGFLFVLNPKGGANIYFLGHHLFFDGTAILLIARAIKDTITYQLHSNSISLEYPFKNFLNNDNNIPEKNWIPINEIWWSYPFRILDRKYNTTTTVSFKALLGSKISSELSLIDKSTKINSSEILIFAFAKTINIITNKSKIIIMQPRAGRDFNTSSLVSNIYWNTYLHFDFNISSRDEMIKSCKNTYFIKKIPESISCEKFLLPISSVIINFDSNSTSNSLKWTTKGEHNINTRGGLWEIQLSIGYGLKGIQTDWIYRNEYFSSTDAENWVNIFRQQLKSLILSFL